MLVQQKRVFLVPEPPELEPENILLGAVVAEGRRLRFDADVGIKEDEIGTARPIHEPSKPALTFVGPPGHRFAKIVRGRKKPALFQHLDVAPPFSGDRFAQGFK